MAATLVWRCKCGCVFFAQELSLYGDSVDRYIFWGWCSRCGRRRQRCFWLHEPDYKGAWDMLRATKAGGLFMSMPLMSMADRRAMEVTPWVRKMTRYMLRRGFGAVKIYTLLAKRVYVTRWIIQKIANDYGVQNFILEDAPPFCYPYLMRGTGDMEHLTSTKKGEICDLCPFCMLQCDREGVRCKAVKEEDYRFRFVQIGQDLKK